MSDLQINQYLQNVNTSGQRKRMMFKNAMKTINFDHSFTSNLSRTRSKKSGFMVLAKRSQAIDRFISRDMDKSVSMESDIHKDEQLSAFDAHESSKLSGIKSVLKMSAQVRG